VGALKAFSFAVISSPTGPVGSIARKVLEQFNPEWAEKIQRHDAVAAEHGDDCGGLSAIEALRDVVDPLLKRSIKYDARMLVESDEPNPSSYLHAHRMVEWAHWEELFGPEFVGDLHEWIASPDSTCKHPPVYTGDLYASKPSPGFKGSIIGGNPMVDGPEPIDPLPSPMEFMTPPESSDDGQPSSSTSSKEKGKEEATTSQTLKDAIHEANQSVIAHAAGLADSRASGKARAEAMAEDKSSSSRDDAVPDGTPPTRPSQLDCIKAVLGRRARKQGTLKDEFLKRLAKHGPYELARFRSYTDNDAKRFDGVYAWSEEDRGYWNKLSTVDKYTVWTNAGKTHPRASRPKSARKSAQADAP